VVLCALTDYFLLFYEQISNGLGQFRTALVSVPNGCHSSDPDRGSRLERGDLDSVVQL
jgi:hypothetical protein